MDILLQEDTMNISASETEIAAATAYEGLFVKEAEVDLGPFRGNADGVVFETSAHIICGKNPAA